MTNDAVTELDRQIFDALTARLEEALKAHLAQFPELNRDVLLLGYVNALMLQAGSIVKKVMPTARQRAMAVQLMVKLLAEAVGAKVEALPG